MYDPSQSDLEADRVTERNLPPWWWRAYKDTSPCGCRVRPVTKDIWDGPSDSLTALVVCPSCGHRYVTYLDG